MDDGCQSVPFAAERRSPASDSDRPRSPGNLLLRRSWIVIIGAIVVGALTYVISGQVAATYASSATVAVEVSGTDANATSLGANNFAAQFAQQVSATQVLQSAARDLGSSIPSSSITGGTVAAQNIIAVNATANSSRLAATRAQAVTVAFVKYVSQRVSAQVKVYSSAAARGIAPLTASINSAELQLGQAPPDSSRATALGEQLATLVAERATAEAQVAQTAISGTPTVAIVKKAGAGHQIAPKPKLYAVIGFLLGLVALSRLVVMVLPNGLRSAAAKS
jgi:capsular polysaccharide biosynthesis protein